MDDQNDETKLFLEEPHNTTLNLACQKNFRIDLVLVVKMHDLTKDDTIKLDKYIKSVKSQSKMKILKVINNNNH